MESSLGQRITSIEKTVGNRLPSVFLMTNSLETGGTERQFAAVAQALDRDAFTTSFGCLKREGAFLENLDALVEFSPGGSLLKWGSQRTRLALARHLRKQGTALAHSFDFYSNLMLIPTARVVGVPVVIGSFRQLGDLLTPMQFRAQKMIFQLCDRVICNSEAAADRLRRADFPEGKLTLIPNGLTDDFFAPVSPALPRDGATLNIGMISRMNDPSKRHDAFLRAAARLAARFPNLQFILAGDGPLRPGLEQLAESLGLNGRVVFMGERRDIPAVLASLDVIVLPSASESLSNVILESMAAGVPVVATCIGGNPELIQHGETGLLVPDGDENQLAAALETFLMQPDLRRLCGSKAREKAKAGYGIRQVTDRYQDLYCELLREKKWRPGGC
jgi:glycosyltransferase involved in cell wall biosynthesis